MTHRSSGSSPVVDLTFTGTLNVVAKGSAGDCHIGSVNNGATNAFGFIATGADYPGLVQSLNFDEDINNGRLTMKWLVNADEAWFGYLKTGYTFSSDHRSVTLDADLPYHSGKPEHVKGSISC